MRPEKFCRREDFSFAEVRADEVRAFFGAFHYARGSGAVASLAIGMFRRGVLLGVATWLPPPLPAAKLVSRLFVGDESLSSSVICLSRLAVQDGVPTNAESMLIGACLRVLRRTKRWMFGVTYADEAQGHVGTIYKATNWREAGVTGAGAIYRSSDGALVSAYANGKTRSRAEMTAAGTTRVGASRKRRFVIDLR